MPCGVRVNSRVSTWTFPELALPTDTDTGVTGVSPGMVIFACSGSVPSWVTVTPAPRKLNFTVGLTTSALSSLTIMGFEKTLPAWQRWIYWPRNGALSEIMTLLFWSWFERSAGSAVYGVWNMRPRDTLMSEKSRRTVPSDITSQIPVSAFSSKFWVPIFGTAGSNTNLMVPPQEPRSEYWIGVPSG